MRKEIFPNFYSVIIGTEQLNGRRKDAHFSFINEELIKRGWKHKASFLIADDPQFIHDIFSFIKSDPNSIMFCFGGIGATPDDYTRKVASQVFTNNILEVNAQAKNLILKQFNKDAYPHRINMSLLPKNSKLLKNVINNVPGFYLENRFFFTPGFPSMSQSMVIEALNKYYNKNMIKEYRFSLTAFCGENDIIDLMKKVPLGVEITSLPKLQNKKKFVVISILSEEKKRAKIIYKNFKIYFNNKKIKYIKADISNIDVLINR